MDDLIHTRRASNLSFIFLLVISILLLSAHLTGSVRVVKHFIYYVLSPVPSAATQVVLSAGDTGGTVKELVRVHQENIALRAMLQEYEKLDGEYRSSLEENTRLRALVSFPAPPGTRPIVARVVSREPESWFQSIEINRGSKDGVTVDAPVLSWNGSKPVVLGRVGDLYDHSAEVVLLTNPLFSTPAQTKIKGEDGLLEGQNSPKVKMNYLLVDGTAAIGDEIVTSPLSSVFPQGIAIGTIQDITPLPNEAFKSAVIAPAVDMNSLRDVVVLVAPNH
jgi:rod shape-determining protein MreC